MHTEEGVVENVKHHHMGMMHNEGVRGMGKMKMSMMGMKKHAVEEGVVGKMMGMGMMHHEAALEEGIRGVTAFKNPGKYTRSLGHNVVTSLVGQTTSTIVVTTNANNPESTDFANVIAFLFYGTPGSVSVTDSLGNSYLEADSVTFNTSFNLSVFYTSGVHSLPKNAVITVTHPSSTRRIVMADEFKNFQTSSPADQVAAGYNASVSTFATSGMTPTISQDKEVLYGVIAANTPSTNSFKKPANWTLLHDRGTNASDGNDITLIAQFRTVGQIGTYEVSGTFGTACLWGSITQTFKSEGGGSDVTKDT